MTLESIYYIGQTVAVVALVTSLIFVGFQVRESAKQTQQSIQIALGENQWILSNQAAEFFQLEAGADIFEAVRIGLKNYHDLTDHQKALFTAWAMKHISASDQAVRSAQNNLTDRPTHNAFEQYTLAFLKTKGSAQWWELVGTKLISADFVNSMTGKLQENYNDIPILTEIFPHLALPLETDGALEQRNIKTTE